MISLKGQIIKRRKRLYQTLLKLSSFEKEEYPNEERGRWLDFYIAYQLNS